MHKRCLGFIVLWVGLSQGLWASKLETIAVDQQAGHVTISCALSGTVVHKAFVLKNPNRVVLDLMQTTSTIHPGQLKFDHQLVQRVRIGHPSPQTLRLVFDVNRPVTLRTSTWSPAKANQHGLRLSLMDGQRASQLTQVAVISSPSVTASTQYRARPPMRDVIVVLDPGHGGKDPGATGTRRNLEKHVVLAIAWKLKRLIDKQPGMRAVLTRQGDYYIGLRERMQIARKHNADIFVAIHADAFGNHESNGASVFALSQRGATSEAARWLAEKENYSELGGVNLSGLDDKSGEIRTVLIDLSQTATIGASLQMGDHILRRLGAMTTLHSRRVEQARFVVLKSPDIPSVLIETGFISNPREERNLTSPAYQARLTQAIFQGIKGYFWDYPPHGTRVEALSNVNRRIARNHQSVAAPWG